MNSQGGVVIKNGKGRTLIGAVVGIAVGAFIFAAESSRPAKTTGRTNLQNLVLSEAGVASDKDYVDLLIDRAKGLRVFKGQKLAGPSTDYSYQGDYHFGDYVFGDYSFNDGSYDNGSGVYQSVNPYAKRTLVQPHLVAAK